MSRSPAFRTPWQGLPAELAAAMRPHLAETVQAVIAAASGATPVFAQIEDSKFERDVRAAAQVALDRFLELVGTDEPALPPGIREVFVGLGAAEAREERGPEALLAAFRTSSRIILRRATESLAALRPVGLEEIVDLSDAITAFVDELTAASTDGFALQVREQAGEGERRRRHLAELLLRGGAPESVVLAAATGVGWHGLGAVVPVVLPIDGVRDARFRYAADGVVLERERDAVLLLHDGPRATRAHLAESLAGRGVVVGPRLAWARAPEAVRLAELVARLVGAEPGSAGSGATGSGATGSGATGSGATGSGATGSGAAGPAPVFADDHLATLALHGEPAALAVLSERRLAPLDRLRETQRERLLVTLRSWLLHWGSRSEVAAELFVHPQTVTYRITQLRELFGGDLDDPVARFELQLVLAVRQPSPRRPGDATPGPG